MVQTIKKRYYCAECNNQYEVCWPGECGECGATSYRTKPNQQSLTMLQRNLQFLKEQKAAKELKEVSK